MQAVSTGCRDEGAARAVFAELERRAELVRDWVLSSSEDKVGDAQATSVSELCNRPTLNGFPAIGILPD